MKLASRISSIRRMAWKQCRSCSADSLSMCVDSFARCALAGMDSLAPPLEHRRDGVLGEPVDLEVGMELAQLVGDRHVALGMAEPDRRRDVERALAARLAAHPAARRLGGLDEVAEQQVDLHRIAHVRAVAATPRATTSVAARRFGERGAAGDAGAARPRSPWMHEHRAAHALAERRGCRPAR